MLLLAVGLLLNIQTAPQVLTALLVAGWFVLWAAGAVLAVWKVRCPHCGASLMLRGRLPLSLPPHCPGCGKKL